MTQISEIESWLDVEFPALAAKYGIPGAAVAVYSHGEVVDKATGLLSLTTKVEADENSLFQIGSITKLWTATLVMQLVDDGLVEIDQPLRKYLPEFHIRDESAAATMTIRQLLCHTAGFEGDNFTDTGRNDDAIEKFVHLLADVPQLFPPGELFSYNNAGYTVLGRLVEVIREKPYNVALRDHLIDPLGLAYAATDVSEAILYRAAIGHIQPGPDADQIPAPVWSIANSNAPAGSLLAMRVRDLMTFARMQMNNGVADDGTVVLSPKSVAAMRERQVEVPNLGLLGNAWGLGWEIYDADGGTIIGHDGTTIGQQAFLRITPDHDAAVALLTNGGDAFGLYHDVMDHVLTALAGFSLPPMPAPPKELVDVDVSSFLGLYSSELVDITVSEDAEGKLWETMTPKGTLIEMGEEAATSEMVRLRADALIPAEADRGMFLPRVFVGSDAQGRSKFLHIGRAMPRAVESV